MNYYNEFDPNAAAWLRELIAQGSIPDGTVDERSITELTPSDLHGYTQCHFFAGVGGWSLALQLAGVPASQPLWTGSCPCQPFSSAGKQLGTADERHLWPVFAELVRQCRPPIVIGEQVASNAARNNWLPGVRLDLEGMGYSFGAADLCAPCAGEIGEGRIVRGDQATWERVIIGHPHIRQRIYWVADGRVANSSYHGTGSLTGEASGRGGGPVDSGSEGIRQAHRPNGASGADARSASSSAADGLAHTNGEQAVAADTPRLHPESGSRSPHGPADGLPDTERHGREVAIQHLSGSGETLGVGEADELGGDGPHHRLVHPRSEGPQGFAGDESDRSEPGREHPQPIGPTWRTGWALLPCRDGKTRRTESGISPLVDGLPRGVVPSGDPSSPEYANATAEARAMRLKGYGNAIVPDLAAMFIRAAL